MMQAIKCAHPNVITVYGGVYPSYHAKQILQSESSIDVVVRGEGEATALQLVTGLERGVLSDVQSITYRSGDSIMENAYSASIQNLDACRVAWELIPNWNHYQCFGMGRAAIVQFSRGCPHRCTYCGQWVFWKSWRYRDPVKMADEIEWLHKEHGIGFCTLADENPTTRPDIWQQFLEELIGRNLPVQFFATIRASDIVRDAEILPLYRKAGITYVLMGIETTDPEVIKQIRKGSTSRIDYEACQLLRKNGIFSVIGHVVGLQDETPQTFRNAHRALKAYDGDYLNAMYATPHSWSLFAKQMADVPVAQLDASKWDYRHQVLAQKHLSPRSIFWRVKWLELCFHLGPPKLVRLAKILLQQGGMRRQLIWTLLRTSLVWFAEVGEFLFRTRYAKEKILLREWQGRTTSAPVRKQPEIGLHAVRSLSNAD
jgi:anaerobic magnesium-protoporphyrin IX monomethyl ester cyclase